MGKKKKNILRGAWRIYNLYNPAVINVQDTIQNPLAQHKGSQENTSSFSGKYVNRNQP